MLSDDCWVGEHVRPQLAGLPGVGAGDEELRGRRVQELRVPEHSRSTSRPNSYTGNEADVSSNGDECETPLGSGSGSNASGSGSCSNASSSLRKWGRAHEAEIESKREAKLVEDWATGWQEG